MRIKNACVQDVIRRIKYRRTLLLERYVQNYIFIHINKTGGSSVVKALGAKFQHKTALEKISELGWDVWNQKFTFAFVRNPWDKVVSQYHYRSRTNKTNLRDNPVEFRQWVRLAYGEKAPQYYDHPKMFQPQLDWISDESGKVLVDFVGRFESFQQDFEEACRRLHRTVNLPHLKKSERRSYREYYDDETRDIIQTWYQKDIDHFGYKY